MTVADTPSEEGDVASPSESAKVWKPESYLHTCGVVRDEPSRLIVAFVGWGERMCLAFDNILPVLDGLAMVPRYTRLPAVLRESFVRLIRLHGDFWRQLEDIAKRDFGRFVPLAVELFGSSSCILDGHYDYFQRFVGVQVLAERAIQKGLLSRRTVQGPLTWVERAVRFAEELGAAVGGAACLDEFADRCRMMLDQVESLPKLKEIQESMSGEMSIIVPGRRLLLEGTCHHVHGRERDSRRVYLFSDVLMHGHPRAGLLDGMESYELVRLRVSEPRVEGLLELYTPQKSFLLDFDSATQARAWFDAILAAVEKAHTGECPFEHWSAPPLWLPDAYSARCMLCSAEFTALNRRHHCRGCGKICCAGCLPGRLLLPGVGYADHLACGPCARKHRRSGAARTACLAGGCIFSRAEADSGFSELEML